MPIDYGGMPYTQHCQPSQSRIQHEKENELTPKVSHVIDRFDLLSGSDGSDHRPAVRSLPCSGGSIDPAGLSAIQPRYLTAAQQTSQTTFSDHQKRKTIKEQENEVSLSSW